jgi:hypothetical protein
MYAKLFKSIYAGTLRGNTRCLVVFTNMLAHADAAGWVDMHPRSIAEEVGLTIDEVKAAIAELEAPDPESRSPEEEGRRIVLLDAHRSWGWRVVNHGKYRAIRNEEDRREQNRLAQERFRKKSKQSKPRSAQAEAEAEAEEVKTSPDGEALTQQPQQTQQKTERNANAMRTHGEDPPGFLEFWATWPKSDRKQDRKKCAAKWKREGFHSKAGEIISHVEAMKSSKQWREGFEPAPLTYLNGERWADGQLQTSAFEGCI